MISLNSKLENKINKANLFNKKLQKYIDKKYPKINWPAEEPKIFKYKNKITRYLDPVLKEIKNNIKNYEVMDLYEFLERIPFGVHKVELRILIIKYSLEYGDHT